MDRKFKRIFSLRLPQELSALAPNAKQWKSLQYASP